MPTKEELSTQLDALTVRAEAAEAKVTEIEAAMGDMVDAPEPADYPLPLPEDAEEGADAPTTNDAMESVIAWQEVADIAIAELALADDEDADRMSKEQIESLVADLENTKEQLAKANVTVEGLKAQMGSMRMAVGGEAPLTYDEIEKAIKKDHKVQFQVVAEYKHMGIKMTQGRVLRAQHYQHLLSYVQDGLRLIFAPED